jgi:uncharacterized membrane protein YbhN (UPF0104 family)
LTEQNKTRNRILNILKIVVSLAGLLLIVLTQDMDQVLQALGNMNWLPFLAALVLFLCGGLVRAYRWGSLVWALGVSVRYRRLVSLYFVGSFFNLFLPTGIGGDAIKMYELSRGDQRAASAISSVLVDRFLGLFILFAIALLAVSAGGELVEPQVRVLIAGVFAGSLIGAALLLQRTWIEAWGRRLGVGRLLGRIKILRELYETVHLYGAAALLKATAASVVWNLILILGYYLLGLAVGIEISLWYYFLFIPVVSAVQLIPSVGGLGIREATITFLFSQVEGVGQAQAAALGFAYLAMLIIVALLGGVLYLTQGMKEART